MNASAFTERETLLLEVLYFSSGLKSRLYGAAQRPGWLPSIDRIGLQNDLYLGPGQHVVDVSRLVGADGTHRTTWIGLYTHAKDLYGDRGNFCGVGVWLSDGLILDHHGLLHVLNALLVPLNGAAPPSSTNEIDERVAGDCQRALDFLAVNALGKTLPGSGQPFAGNYEGDARYICLDEPWAVGSEHHRQMAEAVDALLLAEPRIKPGRLLFVFGSDITFDSRTDPARRSHGMAGLFGPARATKLALRGQLVALAVVAARARALERDLEAALARQAEFDARQSRLESELADARRDLERHVAEESALLDQAEKQEKLSARFWDLVEERLHRSILAGLAANASAPQVPAEPKHAAIDTSGILRRLGLLDERLQQIEFSLKCGNTRASTAAALPQAPRDDETDGGIANAALTVLYEHPLLFGALFATVAIAVVTMVLRYV
jgi:hypothetical protein